MLQDKYLPQFHFRSSHSVIIKAPADRIFPLLEQADFRHSRVIRFLFFLRGIKADKLEGLRKLDFAKLEVLPGREITLGIIGMFWRPSGNLQRFMPDEFIPFKKPGFCKATWSFQLNQLDGGTTALETETRVACLDEATRRKFSKYWFFVRPFSGIIRKEILKGIKQKAEERR